MSGVAGLVGLGMFVLGSSVWLESRYVFGSSDSRLVEKVREYATKPIAAAIGRQAQQHFQKRRLSSAPDGLADLGVKANIAGLLNDRLSPQLRGVYAYRLAQLGTPEARAALLRAFQTAPPQYRPFLAQLLGSIGTPSFESWLKPLLNDPDEKLAAAAIQGLGTIGGEENTVVLAQLLADAGRTESIRLEAAAGLATIGTSGACDALIRVFPQFAETESSVELLQILGRFPFREVGSTFREFLVAPETPPEARIAAVEALAESTPDAVPFLLELAKKDLDAEVRASAAWALSAQGQPGLGATLAALALQEPDPDVRRRCYEASIPQVDSPGEALLPRVLEETDISARVAGFNTLASAAARTRTSALDQAFDRQIVPELESIATSPNSLNIQMRAVFALRRSGSARAEEAMASISRSRSIPAQVSAAASHGLL